MAIQQRSKVLDSFSMASMTDIVFLLLIFFLVTSTLINPNALKLLVPKSSNQISTKEQTSVSIKHNLQDNTFSYHLNGRVESVSYNTIEPQIQKQLMNEEDPVFAIYADRTVPIEKVVELMNIGKRNKYKVILATAPEE